MLSQSHSVNTCIEPVYKPLVATRNIAAVIAQCERALMGWAEGLNLTRFVSIIINHI